MSRSPTAVVAPVTPRAGGRSALAVAGGVGLACLAAVIAVHASTGAVVPLLGVLGGLLVVPHAIAAIERRWTVFHPVVMFGAFCFFGYFLRSFHLLWYENLDLYHIFVDRTEAVELLGRGVLVVIVAVLAYYFGYLSPAGAAVGARLPVPSSRWSPGRAGALAFVFTMIGATSYFLYARRAGGLVFLMTNMEMRSELSAGMHVYFFGIRFLELGLLLRYAKHLQVGVRGWRRASLAIHALAVMLLVALLGSRAWAMEVLFMMLVTRAVLFRPPRARVLAVTVAAGLCVFSVYDQYRNLTHEGVEAGELQEIDVGQVATVYEGVLGGRNFDMMDNLLSILHYTPDRLPYLLGSSYAHYFANWIPRRMWSGKPKGVDSILAERVYGWGMGGAPPGTIGELWMNFQWAGVIVGMALFGALCRLIRTYSTRVSRHPFLALGLGAALVFVGMVTRGSFFQVGTVFTMRFLPLLVASFLVAAPRARTAERAGGAPGEAAA
jgi:oligosaccharide repeat unit polymerase